MKFARAVVLGGAAAATAVSLSGCGVQSSEGDNVGKISSFSLSGVFCKTWEGQMAMDSFKPHTTYDSNGNASSTTSNSFAFSVTDPAIVPQIQEAMRNGSHVDLHYSGLIANNPCKSETDHIVTRVTVLPPRP